MNFCGSGVGYMNSCDVDADYMNSCGADNQLLSGRSTSARIFLSESVKMLTTVTLRDLMLTVRVDSLSF